MTRWPDRIRTYRTKTKEQAEHFLWEMWRIIWPLLTCLLISYWFETLREQHDGANWLRTLSKLNHVALGIIVAHIAWSTLFRYLDMRTLFHKDKMSFRAVVMARAVFYGAIVVAVAFGL